MNNIFEYQTIIQYTDVNENNELSKKGLVRILLEVAGLHSDSAGYGLNNVHQTNLAWIILYWQVKTFYNPKWNSKLTIKTWASDFSRITSHREFEVYDENNKLVAIASSKWALINSETHSFSKFTNKMIEAYGNGYQKKVFDTHFNDKEKEPENSTFVYEYHVRRRDLDTNHHVDNIFYIDYAYDALPSKFGDKNFQNLEIIYKNQIVFGDIIKCFYYYDETSKKHFITIKNNSLDTVHSIVKLW